MLIELADKIICIDSTHHITQYKFQLVTLLVVDENGNGFPAAWFVAPSESKKYMDLFFSALLWR